MSFCFLPGCKLEEPTSGVVIYCSPNRLHGFYSVLLEQKKKITNECIFLNFFKCQQTGIENYLDNGIFILNDSKVKMVLKDVALISIMKVVRSTLNQLKRRTSRLGNDIFSKLETLHTKESINPFFIIDSFTRLN